MAGYISFVYNSSFLSCLTPWVHFVLISLYKIREGLRHDYSLNSARYMYPDYLITRAGGIIVISILLAHDAVL